MKNLTFLDEWEAWQQAASLSDRTINERRGTVAKLLEMCEWDASKLQPIHIIQYLGRRNLTASSRATYHASINAYCRWLVEYGVRADNPCDRTPAPKRPKGIPRPVQGGQLVKLLEAASRRRTRMMILLAVLAGLRVHEIAKVRGEDFDLERGTVIIVGKGGSQAYLPLHAEIIAAAEFFPASGYWFPSYTGNRTGASGPILPQAVSKAIKDTMARAGFDGKPHQLRHWYGTELLDQGEDLRTVQELMRHQTVATTEIYTKVSDTKRRAAIARLTLPEAA